ncbi:MAG: flagellar brake protein [Thermodesulfobacteriota bacterium]
MAPQPGSSKDGTPRLTAEIGTVMQVTFSRSSKPIKALFVGMEKNAYILLRFPPGAGIHDHLFEGNKAVIKYVAAGRVYGFQTAVIGYMYKRRLILVVLSYPRNLETHLLRGEQRVDFFAPATLSVAGNNLHGFVVDLSPSGCRFAFEASQDNPPFDFNVIQEVNLSFQVVGLEGYHDFGCQLKNTAQDGAVTSLGLQFNKVNPPVIQEIKDYVTRVSSFLEGD